MTEPSPDAPRAAWYPDPAHEAAYRWWDGVRWTSATRAEPERPQTVAEVPVADPAADPLPSRRSLRAAAAATPASPAAAPPVPAPYVPLNPLVTAPVPQPTAHPTGQQPYVQQPVQQPYGQQQPYTQHPYAQQQHYAPQQYAQQPYAQQQYAQGGYGNGSRFLAKPTVMPVDKAINRPARNGMALGVLSMLLTLILVGATMATGHLLVVWSVWGLAGLAWSIFGLVKARRWEAQGLVPVGAHRAVAGIVLCSLALLGQGTETGLALAAGVQPATGSALPAGGTGTGTGTGTGAGAAATTPPVVAVQQGDGTYAYSQATAQSSIGSAYASTLKSTPTSVECPASEPMQISVSFQCRVTLPGGTVTTAQVTIMDAQGHAEVQVH
ncbi:DUF2510 domain-containing protein [Frondihabitans peucedani]|uniref:DUF2510 domain-containing protein n=1 Tax=Frondihabitans peucedani TaxID=598626 RepID=A0ABP8DZS2_9MICO